MVINKNKIAISIDKKILSTIDGIIDKQSIKNRSQAIEFALRRGMQLEKVKDAVMFIFQYDLIYFQYTHKGQIFLQQMINFLVGGGIEQLFILSQHPKNKLEPQLKNIDFCGIKVIIKYFEDEDDNLPMLYEIKEELGNNFLVTNGDSLQKFRLSKMIEFHLSSNKLATILLIIYPKPELYTSIFVEGNEVVKLIEREPTTSNIVYGGTAILNKRVFDFLKERKDKHLETTLFLKLIKAKQINGFFNYGEYQHMPDIYDPKNKRT